MRPFCLLVACLVLCVTVQVQAQCPNCPKSYQAPLPAMQTHVVVASSGAHWTYPGDIASHLRSGHGQSTEGLTREQMLRLHDSLHESVRGRGSVTVNRTATRATRRTGWYLGKFLGR